MAYFLQLWCRKVSPWLCYQSNFPKKSFQKRCSLTLSPNFSTLLCKTLKKKKKKPQSGARSAQHSGVKWTAHSRNYPPWTAWWRLWSWESNLFLNTSWTFFLASKFAANSGVQGISESFLFLDFPLAHHNFFHFRAKGLEFTAVPTWGWGEAQRFCGDFWTGLKASNWPLGSQIFTCMLSLPSLPLHSPDLQQDEE